MILITSLCVLLVLGLILSGLMFLPVSKNYEPRLLVMAQAIYWLFFLSGVATCAAVFHEVSKFS